MSGSSATETSTPKVFSCPKCSEEVEKFTLYRPSNMLKCPKCKKILRRGSVPNEFIIEVESGKPGRPRGEGESRREERGLFRKERTPAEIVEEVLREHGTKDSFIDYVVRKTERRGGLYPEQLRDMLRSLDSGIKQKSEMEYVVGDYYEAVQAEHDRTRDTGDRHYPPFTEREEAGGPWPTGGGPEEIFFPRFDQQGRRIVPREGAVSTALTERRLMEILDQRESRQRERERFDRMEDATSDLREMVTKLTMEIKNVKDNPPTTTPPDVVTKAELAKMQTDSYVKMLEKQSESMEKAVDKYDVLLDKVQTRHEAQVKEIREAYEKRVDKLEEDVKEASKKGRTYQDTTERAIDRGADVVERLVDTRGQAIERGVRALEQLAGGEVPPKREGAGKSGVANRIPKEFLEA